MALTEWTWATPWWWALVIINIINVIICVVIFVKSSKSKEILNKKYLKIMRIMGLLYCLIALYRSIFVTRYLSQLAWFDTMLNSSLLIRLLAIIAELSFAALIAKSLLRLNKDIPGIIKKQDNNILRFLKLKTPYIFFISLFIAQFFATGGLITKIRVLFAIEETLWGLAFLLITPLVVIQLQKIISIKDEFLKKQYRLAKTFSMVMTIFCLGYGIYSLGYHLPIEYWPAAIAQLQMETPVPAFKIGNDAIYEAFTIVNPSRDLSEWGGIGFVIWHTGYFSICVWMVLLFMNGPRKLEAQEI
jgi:hypothetical protein